MQEERQKILEMLAEGKINVDEAQRLLEALSGTPKPPPQPQPQVHEVDLEMTATPTAGPPRLKPRMLHIRVDEGEKTHVNISIPLGLAKFAVNFIPKDAQATLNQQKIDLSSLLQSIKDEVPDGKIIEIDAKEDGDNVKVLMEVR